MGDKDNVWGLYLRILMIESRLNKQKGIRFFCGTVKRSSKSREGAFALQGGMLAVFHGKNWTNGACGLPTFTACFHICEQI